VSLSPGTRLGAYEIVALVGEGGMGEIYRARDTRLDRTVAIKVLASALAADPQLRERFEREARAISALNHPHICTLFDVGHHEGTDYLVLEYLEGETLADRLAGSGRVAIEPHQALRIAIEICDALDRAHRTGIVHRDLKPANVMLTKSGAKLLDFGLAKSAAPVVAASGLSMLPTTPPNLTAQGTILGTFQYMAPEQIEGLEADARTDIFAFGALLFEMLTGRRAFEGTTRARLLGAILKDEPPPVSRLRSGVPVAVDRITATCLAKDPDDRYQSARDLLRDLKWAASGSGVEAVVQPAAPPARSNRVAWLIAALSTLALVVTAATGLRRGAEVAPAAGAVRFTILPPENTTFGGPIGGGTGPATQLAVSPDGRHVVYVARSESTYRIWLRPLASLEARPIPGSEGGSFTFWSPDSRLIGFFAGDKLKKVSIAGGPPLELCTAAAGRGGSWNRDNVILFASVSDVGLQRVSAAGGTPTAVTTPDKAAGETSHRWPHFLPDGQHFLYTATAGTCCPPSRPGVVRLASLDTSRGEVALFEADSAVSYADGHLLFRAGEGSLMAQPFDLAARRLTGDAFPIAQEISWEGSRYVAVSVSEMGTLVYGESDALTAERLTWFDRGGRLIGTVGEEAAYSSIKLSPDERRVAVGMGTGSPVNRDIWLVDLGGNAPSRLTFDPGADQSAVWSPDGRRIAFEATRSGRVSLRQQSTAVTTADEAVLDDPNNLQLTPTDWSADGRYIAYTSTSSGSSDVWVLPMFGDRKPFPVVHSQFQETNGVFSPDGRWLAYTSNESGQGNILVQPFPSTGGKYQVSRDGGTQAVWRADGKELFYMRPDGAMMAVSIDAKDQFIAGVPQALFQTTARPGTSQRFAVSKDGKRFLISAAPQSSRRSPITVVLNWTAAIQK
jgi:Tol biopolymer transport system component